MAVPSGAPWPLTGRDGELADVERPWDGQGLVIVGLPGVGKTRLAEEILTRLARQGYRTARATASAAAAEVPLGAVAGFIPDGVDLADPVQCFAAVAAGLRGHRWVFLVDDLHLLDAASVMLLRQLMDAGVIRLIGTVRATETAATAYVALCGGDRVHRLDLAELDPAATGTLLEAVLAGPVDRPSVLQFHAMSGGNPLYLRELVHGAIGTAALTRTGAVWGLAGRPPTTPLLGELVAARVAAAGPRAREALELVALCEPVTLGAVRAVAPVELVAELADDGILRSDLDGQRVTLSLAHPLYGEAVRAGISPARRAEILLAQAERTEALGARRSEDALRIAAWRLAATGTANPTLLLQAAALARHAGDYDRASQLTEAAWRRERSTRTARAHATALVDLARHDDAERFLRDAEAVGPELDTAALFTDRVDNLTLQGRLEDADRLLVGRTDPASRLALATVRYFQGRVRECADECASLLLLPDPAIRQDAAVFAASALLRGARSAEAARALAPLQRFLRAGAEGSEQRANTRYADFIDDVDAYAHTLSGELPAAERILTALYEQAVTRRESTVAARRATGLAYVLLDRGRPQSALRVLHPILGVPPHWNVLSKWAHATAVICAAMVGRTDFLDRYMAAPPEVGADIESASNRIARAWHAATRGDRDTAADHLVAAADETRELGQHLHSVWVVHTMGRLGLPALARPYWEVPVEDEFLRARLAFTRATHDRDADRLVEAAETCRRGGADLYAAEAFAQAALIHQEAGRTRAAASAEGRARELAAWCEGARTPALAALPVRSTPLLTRREAQIAELAATEGRSSKAVADALHLSVRTVENHLQKIYLKLGVGTRSDLAIALAERATA